VRAADDAGGYPVVSAFLPELPGEHDMRAGDQLVRIGDLDTRGRGHFDILARLPELAGADHRIDAEVIRDERRIPIEIHLVQNPVPWFRMPLLLGMVGVGLIVLLRAPARRDSQRLFAAFLTFVIFESLIYGGSQLQNWVSFATFNLVGPLALALLTRWIILFPPELDDADRFSVRWAWRQEYSGCFHT